MFEKSFIKTCFKVQVCQNHKHSYNPNVPKPWPCKCIGIWNQTVKCFVNFVKAKFEINSEILHWPKSFKTKCFKSVVFWAYLYSVYQTKFNICHKKFYPLFVCNVYYNLVLSFEKSYYRTNLSYSWRDGCLNLKQCFAAQNLSTKREYISETLN